MGEVIIYILRMGEVIKDEINTYQYHHRILISSHTTRKVMLSLEIMNTIGTTKMIIKIRDLTIIKTGIIVIITPEKMITRTPENRMITKNIIMIVSILMLLSHQS